MHSVLLQLAHTPRVVVDDPPRNCPSLHLGWLVHVPFEVADWPVTYCPGGHVACAPQANPSVVPPQLPDRNCPVPQLTFLQAVQVPAFVADGSRRYSSVLQVGCVLHM